MTVVDSVAAVRLDEESGRLAGDHRIAHVRSVAVRAEHVDAAEARSQLLRVAARDREADALVGDAPDARRRRARVEAELGLQPGRAADRELAQ
jgi:hypothetical protein